jgi:hypothetical protein
MVRAIFAVRDFDLLTVLQPLVRDDTLLLFATTLCTGIFLLTTFENWPFDLEGNILLFCRLWGRGTFKFFIADFLEA